MRRTRLDSRMALVALSVACGCGRIGYDPLVTFDPLDARNEDTASSPQAPRDAARDPAPEGAAVPPAGLVDAPTALDGSAASMDVAQGKDLASQLNDGGADVPPLAADLAPAHPLPSCTSALSWLATFDVDPTGIDSNGDGVLDWATDRSKKPLAAQFSGGAWRPATSWILDTRPLRAWNTRTLVFVRMQNLMTDTTQVFAKGALVWVNLNNVTGIPHAVSLSLIHEPGGGQTLHLSANGSPNANEDLTKVTGLPDRLIDIALDLDPVNHVGEMWVDGQWQGSYPLPNSGGNNADHYATVATFQGPSIFDDLRLVSCQ